MTDLAEFKLFTITLALSPLLGREVVATADETRRLLSWWFYDGTSGQLEPSPHVLPLFESVDGDALLFLTKREQLLSVAEYAADRTSASS